MPPIYVPWTSTTPPREPSYVKEGNRETEEQDMQEGEMYVYVDTDSDLEGEMPRLIHRQSWTEIMQEEERIMEENKHPRRMPGCYKARKDKEDTWKEGEEDRDREGTLS